MLASPRRAVLRARSLLVLLATGLALLGVSSTASAVVAPAPAARPQITFSAFTLVNGIFDFDGGPTGTNAYSTASRNAWSTSRATRRGLHRTARQEPPPGAPAPVVGSDTAVSEAREQLCGARSRLGCLKPRAAS